jgi:hypothetical protein
MSRFYSHVNPPEWAVELAKKYDGYDSDLERLDIDYLAKEIFGEAVANLMTIVEEALQLEPTTETELTERLAAWRGPTDLEEARSILCRWYEYACGVFTPIGVNVRLQKLQEETADHLWPSCTCGGQLHGSHTVTHEKDCPKYGIEE